EIEPEQMRKLLATGRSKLLPGFVSQGTRRKFKAYLVRGADGKIGFEFEPRPAKPGAAAKAAGKAAAGSAKAAAKAAAKGASSDDAARTGSDETAEAPGKPAAAARKSPARKAG